MARIQIKYNREYQNLTIEQLKQEFVKNAFMANWSILKPGLTDSEAIKRANHHLFETIRLYFELRMRGQDGWNAIRQLSEHPDESARLRAAKFLLFHDYAAGRAVIEEMAKNPDFWAPHTVKRKVAFAALQLRIQIMAIEKGRSHPFPDTFAEWLEERRTAKPKKEKPIDVSIKYNGQYRKLDLVAIRELFLDFSQQIQAIKVDDSSTIAKEFKVKREAIAELGRLYVELRERGEEGINLLREIANSSHLPAKLEAGYFLQWVDPKFACDLLSELGDRMYDFEDGSIERETCSDALCTATALGPIVEDLTYATIDPYQQWKEEQVSAKK